MRLSKFNSFFITLIAMISCEGKLENTWQSKPHINAFNEEEGVALFIKGERLSGELNDVQISFFLNQDLISGGFKQIFSFTLNGESSWGEDYLEVITPTGEAYQFEIYDGLLFNIDYESNDINRFVELMNNDFLEIHSGNYGFTMSTKDFLELYRTHFLQPTT